MRSIEVHAVHAGVLPGLGLQVHQDRAELGRVFFGLGGGAAVPALGDGQQPAARLEDAAGEVRTIPGWPSRRRRGRRGRDASRLSAPRCVPRRPSVMRVSAGGAMAFTVTP